MDRKLSVIFLAAVLTGAGSSVYVGAAPGVQDLGTVERGNTYDVTFYTTASGFGGDIQIEPNLFQPNSNFYSQGGDSYEFVPEEASQEDISDWISYRQDSFTVSQESRTVTIGGSRAEVNGEVNMFLDVPQSAEPGYHAIGVDLNPQLDDGSGGQQVSTLSVAQYYLVFRVPGNAERDLTVTGVEALRSGDSQIQMNFNVRNTGTVTTQIRPNTGEDALNLIDPSSGQQLDSITTSREFIEPGETREITSYWDSTSEIEAGSYQVRGSMNYLTGNAIFEDSFDVTSFIQIDPSEENNQGTNESSQGSAGSGQQTSSLLVLMVLVALGVLMYSFDLDPIWIIAVLGFLGISSFILMTGLPVYLIGIVLILTAAVFIVS